MLRDKISQKIFWPLLALSWMGIIFFLSTDRFAESKTLGLLASLMVRIWPYPSSSSLETFNWALRKGAHITIYLVLFLLIAHTLALWRPGAGSPRKYLYYSLILTILYAFSDEYHQSFTASRMMAATDVLWDSLGAVMGMIIYLYIWKRRGKRLSEPETAKYP